ncbi:MAG: DUF4058 family protein [Cyanobacteria bacterium J06635_1]
MPSPFPGMNPYLEHPERWSTVHNRLIVALADFLTPQLLPKYQVDIEKRVYEIIGANSLLVGLPDVTVQSARDARPDTTVATSPQVSQPIQVQIPVAQEVREAYLEVKDAATQIVVTAIEILSPTNKQGEGLQKYLQKRQQVLSSQTHLVEIDLLRVGKPLPLVGEPLVSDYRILVSCSEQRPRADLYAFNVVDPIPPFALPLREGDSEPQVPLQDLIEAVYDRAGYDYFIDYKADPIPALPTPEQTWLEQLLKEKNLR